MWDVITCPCPRYLLLAHKSTYIPHPLMPSILQNNLFYLNTPEVHPFQYNGFYMAAFSVLWFVCGRKFRGLTFLRHQASSAILMCVLGFQCLSDKIDMLNPCLLVPRWQQNRKQQVWRRFLELKHWIFCRFFSLNIFPCCSINQW